VLKEFREFVSRGSVVDLAVGVVIGGAFGTIVKSLVDDLLMPPVGLLLGGVDATNLFVVLKQGAMPGPYVSLADAKAAGAVTLNYGLFINAFVGFLIVAFAIFMLLRGINAIRRQSEAAAPATKECQYCVAAIPLKATRCPQCTSQLSA
jgi:large conductance mechanosensitive channel